MHLVDEQDIALTQVGQDSGQIASALDGRPRADLQAGAHFVADDVGERRLAQTRGTIEQHVIERLAPAERGLDQDREVLA